MEIYTPPLGRINKIILIGVVAIFLVSSILERISGMSLVSVMGLRVHSFFGGQFYQLVTYPLVAGSFFSLLFDALILWFIGGRFESSWRERRYLSFLVFSSLGGGILFLVVGLLFFQEASSLGLYPLSGLSGVCSALCIAYALIYPDHIFSFMLLFPMKAKYFCALLVGVELYQGLFTPFAIASWGHMGTMVSGVLVMLFFSRKHLKRPSFLGKMANMGKRKNSFKVIKGDKTDPRYFQ